MSIGTKVPTTEGAQAVFDFLDQRFNELHPGARVFRDAAKLIGQTLQVYVDLGQQLDAWDGAELMGKVEEEWNYREPEPEFKVFILPAGIPDDA